MSIVEQWSEHGFQSSVDLIAASEHSNCYSWFGTDRLLATPIYILKHIYNPRTNFTVLCDTPIHTPHHIKTEFAPQDQIDIGISHRMFSIFGRGSFILFLKSLSFLWWEHQRKINIYLVVRYIPKSISRSLPNYFIFNVGTSKEIVFSWTA